MGGHKRASPPRPITKSWPYRGAPPPMPECWGHRGASGAFPENTIASFERAVQDGSEGIESDVHITRDNVIVMFHDPSLERTTNGKGFIREQNYHGPQGIEHVRTTQEPVQKIPTFKELCDLLMRDDCRHVKANIDIKPDNDPERLFRLMKSIVSQYPAYETALSPRLILGLWHPKFLRAAKLHVPHLRRIHIGGSPSLARKHFWDDCDGFSMYFASLVGSEGQAFLREAQQARKDVFVWTVNRPDEMIEATRWGVTAVLTDETGTFRDLRNAMAADFAATRRSQVGLFFRWASWRYWALPQYVIQNMWLAQLERRAGESFTAHHQQNRQNSEKKAAAAAQADQEAAQEVAAAAAAIQLDDEAAAAADTSSASSTAASATATATATATSTGTGTGTRSGTSTAVGSPEVKATPYDAVVPPVSASLQA